MLSNVVMVRKRDGTEILCRLSEDKSVNQEGQVSATQDRYVFRYIEWLLSMRQGYWHTVLDEQVRDTLGPVEIQGPKFQPL